MNVVAAIWHVLVLYGPEFALGVAVGAVSVIALWFRWVRLAAAGALAVIFLLISIDAAFYFDLQDAVRSLPAKLLPHPVAIGGFGFAAVVGGLVAWQLVSRNPHRIRRHHPTLAVIAILVFVGLKFVAPTAIDWFAYTPLFGSLADKTLTAEALQHCQIDHHPGADGPLETLLCPQRLTKEDFSDWLRKAIIAHEDRNFFYHGAVDVHGAVRAIRDTLAGTKEGGSTITQQLARTLFLDRDLPWRKWPEWSMAQRIFDVASQDEILTAYMNVAILPRNMHGFDTAARRYFGARARDLDLAESSLLVGMLPRPNKRDISGDGDPKDVKKRWDEAFAAAKRVLKSMQDSGFATAKQVKDAVKELDSKFAKSSFMRGKLQVQSVDFRPYRDQAIEAATDGHVVLGNSYRLIIALDPALQSALGGATATMTGDPSDGHQGAGVLIEPSGNVLAITGGRTYEGDFNRAASTTRSVGSTAKLLPLIAAIEDGVTLDTVLPAKALTKDGWPNEPDMACRIKSLSLAAALQHSCNRVFVRLAVKYEARVRELAKLFGFTVGDDIQQLPVGGLQTSPAQLSRAYATIANRGDVPELQYLFGAVAPSGGVLYSARSLFPSHVMSGDVAAKVMEALRIPVKSGTAKVANSAVATVYGKTGTSDDATDSVFAGIVKDGFVGAFWLGDDHPKAIIGAHGGGAPATAFRQVVDGYYAAASPAPSSTAWPYRMPELRDWIQFGSSIGFCGIVADWIMTSYLRRRRRDQAAAAAVA